MTYLQIEQQPTYGEQDGYASGIGDACREVMMTNPDYIRQYPDAAYMSLYPPQPKGGEYYLIALDLPSPLSTGTLEVVKVEPDSDDPFRRKITSYTEGDRGVIRRVDTIRPAPDTSVMGATEMINPEKVDSLIREIVNGVPFHLEDNSISGQDIEHEQARLLQALGQTEAAPKPTMDFQSGRLQKFRAFVADLLASR